MHNETRFFESFFGGRLMVGLHPLEVAIGVRIPAPEPISEKHQHTLVFFIYFGGKDVVSSGSNILALFSLLLRSRQIFLHF